MPWLDWQFWAVTAAAVWGLWVLVRQVLPRERSTGPACGSCATGAAACSPRNTGASPGERPKLVVLDASPVTEEEGTGPQPRPF